MTDYEARTVKRRRRTKAELAALDDEIVRVVEAERPIGLRGIYYRVVSAGAIGKTEAGYAVVGRRLKELRRSGRVPYSWVTDGNRSLRGAHTWSSLDEMIAFQLNTYRRSLWGNQSNRVIVLSEKDAILGTVEPVTQRWDVELGATRGYSSETFVHDVAAQITVNTRLGLTTHLLNVGDHDPSGVDLWRDFQQKVREDFAPDGDVEFRRLAVTPEQIDEYGLLTRPTKTADTRSKGFEGGSVEVDAVPSAELRRLVEDAITDLMDQDRLAEARAREAEDRDRLHDLIGGAA